MKKPTISIEDLSSRLEAIAHELHREAEFTLGQGDEHPELTDEDTLCRSFFSFGNAEPTKVLGGGGRGEHLRLPLGWIWWPAKMSPEDGAALTAQRLLATPGVEDVSPPKLDPQFGLVWQAYVVIRTSQ